MVLGHVALELLGIGSWRWLPSRLFHGLVEVIGEVFGLRVADFPSGGETCVGLVMLLASFQHSSLGSGASRLGAGK